MIWKIKIITDGANEKQKNTLCFAGEELKRYLEMSTNIPIIVCEGGMAADDTILLGIGLRPELPEVKDTLFDDAILIDIKGHGGVITGVNARSVLIGVYRYLRELGYTFIRPGKEGEKHPKKLEVRDMYINETPSCRHRTVCIEGSVTYESVRDMIDWLPKVGMNGFYTQFFTPMIFFQRWYLHKGYEYTNPYLKGDALTPEDVDGMVKMYEREIVKRSLVCTKVGHGWTCEPFGTTSYGWDPVDPDSIPEEYYKYVALVNGERKIETTGRYAYVPMIIQLCYGNPEVREIIVNAVVEYCKKNPHVDCISFTVADGKNSYCECELCRDTLPADFTVMILNEIDRRLTEEGIPTRILGSMYTDQLWPPVKYKLNNEDRFSFQFAPISRTYSDAFTTKTDCEIGPFVLNKLKFPESVEGLLAYVREWRKVYHGDMLVFDYYYMWDCYKDLGGIDRSRVIHKDIRNYKELNLTGLISCQGQRVFCPTSLGMNIMASTLWNRDCDFDQVLDYVMRAEYGEDYAAVRNYLQALSTYSLPEVTRLEKPFAFENIPMYEKGLEAARAFSAVIEEHLDSSDLCEATSWKYLKFHTALSVMMITAFIDISNGVDPMSTWPPIEEFINRNEWETRQYFDVFEFKFTFLRLVLPLIKQKERELNIGV